MTIWFIPVVLFMYNLISCDSGRKINNSGVVRVKIQVFDTVMGSSAKPVLNNEFKIWYKDSLAIEEVKTIRFLRKPGGEKSVEEFIKHHVFIYPPSRSFYYYKTFSDTAAIIKKYSGTDSFGIHGGWNFYKERNLEFSGTPEVMSDTAIEQVQYKRVKYKTKKGDLDYISITYFRCDNKISMFKFDKAYSEKIGCPMVRIDDFPVEKGNPMTAQIAFLTDTLSLRELRVFDAWEKNAKQNPVNK